MMAEYEWMGTVDVTLILRGPVVVKGRVQVPSVEHEETPEDIAQARENALEHARQTFTDMQSLSDREFRQLFYDSPDISSWFIHAETLALEADV